MVPPEPPADAMWDPLAPEAIDELLRDAPGRWWLSGGAALDRVRGAALRERENVDISTIPTSVAAVVAALPSSYSVWASNDDGLLPWADLSEEDDPQPLRVFDDERGLWVLQINVEDGAERAWVYKRDPRLQLPWDAAVVDVGGIPTGAPEVQLVWKALRPRPEDDADKDAVLPLLSDEARAWWERAILTIHPHSSWSIHVRTPMFPAKASWNRSNR